MHESKHTHAAAHSGIERLVRGQLLEPSGASRAHGLIAEPATAAQWSRIGKITLAGTGLGQLLAGIVFFFASNWAHLSKWERLGPITLVLTICALVGWRRTEQLSGRLALTASVVLVGVWLAVYGQIYQTGADPWNLFAGWAALTLPWVWAARTWGLWILWWIIVQMGIMLLFGQRYPEAVPANFLACALVSLAGCAACIKVNGPRWTRRLLATGAAMAVAALAVAVTVGGMQDVAGFEGQLHRLGMTMGGALALACLVLVFVTWHLRKLQDLFILAITLGMCIIVLTLNVADTMQFGGGDLIIQGAIILAEVAAAVWWLQKQNDREDA